MGRREVALFLTVSSLLQVACGRGPSHQRIESLDQLAANFRTPPPSYRTAPFWVWNGRVSRSMIDEQLKALKEQGIGGVFIHPRYGLITEYLSREWFESVLYATKRARELGMEVWLYDENSYPSGFAGGHVPASMPESYQLGQGLILERRDTLSTFPDPECPVILARREGTFRVVEKEAEVRASTGPYYVFRKVSHPRNKWYAGFSYVDLILPGVTEKFIEVTMTGYEKAVGSQFGRTVRGVFTDEPHIRPPQREAIRWTPDLFDRFRERFGYDLRPHLPSLFEDVGSWRKVRHDYRKLLLELFEARWAKPWERYCQRRGLLWTGHYWEHSWPDPSECPDGMLMYVHHSMPGIDLLFNQFSEGVNAQFGNVRSVREVASIANQFDRPRVLSETYGGAGWELTFGDMKRLGEWEYVMGVNFMNQHLTLQSLKGDRKMDYPQSFGPHAPWWHLYHHLADHFARLSVALAAGRENCRLLVLEPTSSAWLYAKPGGDRTEVMARVGAPFQQFITRLSHEQVEYDLGSEAVMEKYGRVKNGKLVVGQRGYDALVLPPGFENAEPATVQLLGKFLRAGGKVYSFCVPQYLAGEESEACRQLMERHRGRWTHFDSLTSAAVESLLSWQSIRFSNREGSWLFHQRRELRDGQLLFLVNSSPTEMARGVVELPGNSLWQLDPFDGSISRRGARRLRDGRLQMEFRLQPLGSLLWFASYRPAEETPESDEPLSFRPVDPGAPTEVMRDSLNVLVLDYCDLWVDTLRRSGLFFARAQDLIWQHHGFEENPWFRGIQFRRQLVEADTFGTTTGFEVSFPFQVLEMPPDERLFLVVEQPDIWQVLVNGSRVEPLSKRTWLDPDFAVYPVRGLVQEGSNEVRIVCRPMSIYAELEPVYLLGDFSLVPMDKGWAVAAPRPLGFGAWSEQGCPFYGHSVTYRKTLELDPGERARVRLGRWAGTVAEVRVNGQSAGIIAWPPYELDISGLMKSGTNVVEVVVYGSLKNTLGPYHAEATGQVRPWLFRQAPEQQPPGQQYKVIQYGLFEDFVVETAHRAAE